jgi:hypothetical protein
MPKVSRKEAKEPLQEAVGPSAMQVEAGVEETSGEQLPSKPAFAPLSAADQGQKVEFRRVSMLPIGPCKQGSVLGRSTVCAALASCCLLTASVQAVFGMLHVTATTSTMGRAGTCATTSHDSLENALARALQANHRAPEA